MALPALSAMVAAAVACACASPSATKVKKRTPADPDEDLYGWDELEAEPEPLPTVENPDSGAFGAPARPKNTDAGPANVDGGPVDAGPKAACAGPLAAGDLAIVELMISSRSGLGDDGEWVEIESRRDCWLSLEGVTIASPRGTTGANVATIAEDFELAPGATFVVASSADPTKNHQLPGKVFAWTATDVLKNDGDTVTVKLGATTIDALTYPALSNLTPGRALSFPQDCSPTDRADWQRWSLAFTAWTAGLQGTPNAPNADVTCF